MGVFWLIVTIVTATRFCQSEIALLADCLSWGSFTWFNALGVMAPLAGLPFLLMEWGGALSFMSYVGHIIYGFHRRLCLREVATAEADAREQQETSKRSRRRQLRPTSTGPGPQEVSVVGAGLMSGAAMEMHQIRYFLALCEELNFTKAAERCNVAQPSLTRAIKLLEDEFGGELVNRERGNTHLTELGRMMRPHLAEVYETAQLARSEADKLKKEKRVTLRLGVMCTIAPAPLLVLVDNLGRRHSDLDLEVIDSSAREPRGSAQAGRTRSRDLLPARSSGRPPALSEAVPRTNDDRAPAVPSSRGA